MTDIGNKVLHEQNSIASQHGGFGKGRVVASLDYPTEESVQTITLPKDTKARYVTLELKRENPILKFREVEVYNGPLLGNSRNGFVVSYDVILKVVKLA